MIDGWFSLAASNSFFIWSSESLERRQPQWREQALNLNQLRRWESIQLARRVLPEPRWPVRRKPLVGIVPSFLTKAACLIGRRMYVSIYWRVLEIPPRFQNLKEGWSWNSIYNSLFFTFFFSLSMITSGLSALLGGLVCLTRDLKYSLTPLLMDSFLSLRAGMLARASMTVSSSALASAWRSSLIFCWRSGLILSMIVEWNQLYNQARSSCWMAKGASLKISNRQRDRFSSDSTLCSGYPLQAISECFWYPTSLMVRLTTLTVAMYFSQHWSKQGLGAFLQLWKQDLTRFCIEPLLLSGWCQQIFSYPPPASEFNHGPSISQPSLFTLTLMLILYGILQFISITPMGSSAYRIPGPNKTLYEGECDEEGRPHGSGSMKYSDNSFFKGTFDSGAAVRGRFQYQNGDVYEGDLKNNRPEGEGVWTDSKGVFRGNFIKGEFVNGTVSYADKSFYRGYMVNGEKSGPNGEYIFADGDRFVGSFEKDQFSQGTYESRDGSKYQGSFKKGLKHGKGVLTTKNKLKYTGEFADDKFQGKGTLENLEKGYHYKGGFRDGKKHGRGVYEDRNGNRYDGQFFNNERHGQGVLHFGKRKYDGSFSEGKFHGKGKLYYSIGDSYEGDFEQNKKHGKGVLNLLSAKEKYQGEFSDDKISGFGKYSYSNGDVYVGNFLMNKKHGAGKYTRAEGDILEGCWNQDKKDGQFIQRLVGRTEAHGPYVNNQKHGIFTVYQGGKQRREQWKEGKRIKSE